MPWREWSTVGSEELITIPDDRMGYCCAHCHRQQILMRK